MASKLELKEENIKRYRKIINRAIEIGTRKGIDWEDLLRELIPRTKKIPELQNNASKADKERYRHKLQTIVVEHITWPNYQSLKLLINKVEDKTLDADYEACRAQYTGKLSPADRAPNGILMYTTGQKIDVMMFSGPRSRSSSMDTSTSTADQYKRFYSNFSKSNSSITSTLSTYSTCSSDPSMTVSLTSLSTSQGQLI